MDYGTGAIFGVPGHDQRDFEFATKYRPADHAAWSPPAPTRPREPIGGEAETATASRSIRASSTAWRPRRRTPRSSAAPKPAGWGEGTVRSGAARLGRLAPALLGHADPDRPLRRLRRGAGAARPAAGRAARGRRLRHARQPARPPPDLEARRLPELRRRGAARDRHARHVRRIHPGISSASPASRRTGRSTAPRPRRGCRSTNISAASSMRSCTCSTPASGPGRCSVSASSTSPSRSRACSPGHGDPRDLSAPATAAGSAPRRSRRDGDDWVDIDSGSRSRSAASRRCPSRREHRRPRADRRPIWRRRGALVHALRQPARARPGMVRGRDRGRLALRPAAVAAGDERRPAAEGEDKALERKLHQTIAAVGEAIEALAVQQGGGADLRARPMRSRRRRPRPRATRRSRRWCGWSRRWCRTSPRKAWAAPASEGPDRRRRLARADPALLVEDEVTIAVQVNGKLRDTLTAPRGLAREPRRWRSASRQGPALLGGAAPRKVIVVPDRLVNIVA